MDFTLTAEQQAWKDKAAAFAKEYIEPVAAELDKKGEFPFENVDRMAELGFLGMPFPKEYGGQGTDYVSYVACVEEIAKKDASHAIILSANNSLVGGPIYKFGTEEQKKKYLPDLLSGKKLGSFCLTEKDAGTDASRQKTEAVDKGDYWLLNGDKKFITNGGISKTLIVFAMTDRSQGVKNGITAFIVDADWEGVSAGKIEQKMGIRASQTAEMHFENVKIPKENLLGKPGQGFWIAMDTLDGGRIGVGAQSLGIAQEAFDLMCSYMMEREQFGVKLGKLDTLRFEVAKTKVQLDSARLLVYRAANYKDQGLPYKEAAAMAKYAASRAAVDLTRQSIQYHGGYGYMTEKPVERMYRDAKITEIYEGTNEVQQMVIASCTFDVPQK
ncbi:MAG: acyl-CoA dehydrogenase family protein [Anaerovoracaceae bacterium]|jgi:butyryl-CoA dehydrogenase|nr:acyl-CoA dehydrogenase family protein [Bacillota bacterium]MDY2669948.1 acyl-CoA dehydrogenase family protein [Anaerovoracaceae bacterium]